ncbi:translation initiation factor IF-2-like [Panicum virgatum]|uniref:translation initiation factor IF-2-like n=1 Tax=Panicum virgatum TaxID=38727 RepID=UPI0019D5B503|nr:translation initiation factor IF-2-like [Panicum virgatum]
MNAITRHPFNSSSASSWAHLAAPAAPRHAASAAPRSPPRACLAALATPYRGTASPHPAAPRRAGCAPSWPHLAPRPCSAAAATGRSPLPVADPPRRVLLAAPAPHRGPARRGHSSPHRRFLAAAAPCCCSQSQTRRAVPAAPCPGHASPAPP